MEDKLEYSKTFHENDNKDFQWRLTVSTFKGIQYLNIRKYFLTFEEDYQPTKEGMSIPLDLVSTFKLASGLMDILSNAESEKLQELLNNHELGKDSNASYAGI